MNWDRIEGSFGIFQGITTVAGATQHLCDHDSKSDVDRFFNMRRIPGIDRTVQQSLETIQRCTATKSAQQNNLAALLSSPQPSTLSPKP